MRNLSQRTLLFLGIVSVLWLNGCVTVSPGPTPGVTALKRGVYHKVGPKETLWRIAKMYNVSVFDLVRANNIPDAAHIERDQLIFIPNVEKDVRPDFSAVEDSREDFKWPVKGQVVSYFGEKKAAWVNRGIEIRSTAGSEIHPSRSGEVVFSDVLNGYGYTVIVDHGGGYETVYANNAENLVKVGEQVTPVSVIAKVGKKDALALLHFEVRKDSVANNPLHYLP